MEQGQAGKETASPPGEDWPQPACTEGTGDIKMGRPKVGGPRG